MSLINLVNILKRGAKMRDNQNGEAGVDTLVSLFFITIMAVAAYFISSDSCGARWGNSGYKSEFKVTAGCLIYKDGKWIPEKSFREVN